MTDRRWSSGVPIAAITIVALGVRLWGITFGLPHVRVRPDELYILGTVVRMHDGNPNPGFFDYGGLYMYFVAGLYAVYYGLGWLAGSFANPKAFVASFREYWEPFFLLPRVTSAIAGAATSWLVYAIGRELFGRTVALLSALFLAFAFLHVRDSHYATTDVVMTFFTVATVLAAVRVRRSRDGQLAWIAGALAGCATSAKYYAVFVTLVLAAVEAFHAWDLRQDWRRALRETYIFRMAAACIFVFVVTNPYLFLDWEHARPNIEALMVSTAGGMTPCEWLGRGWSFHLPNSLRYGIGIPMLAAALAGMVWMALRAPREAVILGIFPIAYYAANGPSCNVFVRYMVPVVPFLAIFAAYTAAGIARLIAVRSEQLREPAIASALGMAIVVPTAWSTAQFDYLAAQPDNRIVAAEWIRANVPPGSVILVTGNLYGHPQIERGPNPLFRYIEFDRRAQLFLTGRPPRPTTETPDWIIVQRHPIPYANPGGQVVVDMIARDYELVHTIRALDPEKQNFYDIQDGFYAPFGGFDGVKRFGPNFEIYRRRATSPAR